MHPRRSQQRFHDPASRFPRQGPGRSGSPASTVLSGCYDFLPPIPPHFVSFAWRYHGRICDSLRVARDAKATGRGHWGHRRASPKSPFVPWKRQDLPSSCETPMACSPCSSTPAEPHATRLDRRGDLAPAKGTTRASTMGLSELNTMAFRLAVYASKCGLPQHDARLASGRWLDATAWGSHPQGLRERFRLLTHVRVLLSQA